MNGLKFYTKKEALEKGAKFVTSCRTYTQTPEGNQCYCVQYKEQTIFVEDTSKKPYSYKRHEEVVKYYKNLKK